MTKFKEGNIPWCTGLTKETDERVRKMSDTKMGVKKSNKTRAKMRIAQGGKNNPSWKGGISKGDIYRKVQNAKKCFGSLENYQVAMQGYDGWCAFACDKKAEVVHHLDGRSTRNSHKVLSKINNIPQNLIPLCRSCHRRLHNKKLKINRDEMGRFCSKKYRGSR